MERIKEALDKTRALKRLQSDTASSDRNVVSDLQAIRGTERLPLNDKELDPIPLDPEHLEKNCIFAHSKGNELCSVFDRLRTHVLNRMTHKGWRTLAVISPSSGAGKSLVAINLAMSIAQLPNRKAFLVDLDLRHPSILNYLGVHSEKSLNDFLKEKCSFEETLLNPQLARLSVSGASERIEHSTEQLASRKIQDVVASTKSSIGDGVVIFDLPPVLLSDDAISILPKIDCVLLIIPDGDYSEQQLDDCLLQISGTEIVGTVLNKVKDEKEYALYSY